MDPVDALPGYGAVGPARPVGIGEDAAQRGQRDLHFDSRPGKFSEELDTGQAPHGRIFLDPHGLRRHDGGSSVAQRMLRQFRSVIAVRKGERRAGCAQLSPYRTKAAFDFSSSQFHVCDVNEGLSVLVELDSERGGNGRICKADICTRC